MKKESQIQVEFESLISDFRVGVESLLKKYNYHDSCFVVQLDKDRSSIFGLPCEPLEWALLKETNFMIAHPYHSTIE